MGFLKVPLNDEKKDEIRAELKRLFMLQDRQIGDEKCNFYIQEIENDGFPFNAVVKGIRALSDCDLKSVKFFTIKESIRKFIDFQEQVTSCQSCRGHGIVSMIRDDGYSFAFACQCSAGRKIKGMPQWSGSTAQELNGKKFSLYEFVLLGDKYAAWKRGMIEKEEVYDPEIESVLSVVGGGVVRRETVAAPWDE